MALLDAAKAEEELGVGRVLLGVLAGAGLRISEAFSLRWRHIDLPTGSLHVIDSKTSAGIRTVDLTEALHEELTLWRAESGHTAPDDYVITTSTGRKHNPSNLRRDVLHPAIDAANVMLAKDGIAPIAGGVAFHVYVVARRACARCAVTTCATHRAGSGTKKRQFTMSVYAKASKRRDRLSGAHLKAYDRAIVWAQMGTSELVGRVPATAEATKTPSGGAFVKRMMGLEPTTFCMATRSDAEDADHPRRHSLATMRD
jgi:hypothetical protein